MKIFYSYKQIDEVLRTLKTMKEQGSLSSQYVSVLNKTLEHSYKGIVLYFFKELTKDKELFCLYNEALKSDKV